MSGAEVAGLVLAVLPLFISALEHYNKGLEPIKSFFQWKSQLPGFIRGLRTQRVHLEQNLKVLLSPLLSLDEITTMMADGTSELWKGEISDKLQERLGESFDEYRRTFLDCEETLKSLIVGLDINDNGKACNGDLTALLQKTPATPSQTDGSTRIEFRKRIKFSMSKKKMKLLIEKLDALNITLNRFSYMSEKLAPYRTTSKARFTYPLTQIRESAHLLHQALTLAWKCNEQCNSPHVARLRLEPRIMDAKNKHEKRISKNDTLRFKLLVSVASHSQNTSAEAKSHSWQETGIKVVIECADDGKEIVTLSTNARIPQVKFVTPSSAQIKGTNDVDLNDLFKVDNICTTMAKARLREQCLLFSLDKQGELRGAYTEGAFDAYPGNSITLEELLSSSHGNKRFQKRLRERERRLLAVNLASSLLQLHSTPWIDTFFSKKDISFLLSDPSTMSIGNAQPYVSRSFPSKSHLPTPITPRSESKVPHGNPSILALGIVLLELYYCETLESACGVEASIFDFEKNGTTLLCSALEWVEEATNDISFKYLQAAQHCIKCFFDTQSRSLMDDKFRQAVCEKVLVPLQEELATFLEGPG